MTTKPCCRCGTAVVALPQEARQFALCSGCWRPMPAGEISRQYDAHLAGTQTCQYHP